MPPKRRRARVLKRPAANTSIVPRTEAATTTLAVHKSQDVGPRADFRNTVASTLTTEWNVFVRNFRNAYGERLMKMNDLKPFLMMRLRRSVECMPKSDQLSSSVIDRAHKFMFGAMSTIPKTGIADLTGQRRFVQVDATMELALIYFSEFALGRHVAENWAASRPIELRHLSADGNEDDETPMVIKP